MVRLKGYIICYFINCSLVSIPYGSIKSRWLDGFLCFSKVSIPYGSIKSISKKKQKISTVVSIPYGSIKSELHIADLQVIEGFNSLWFD